MLKTKIRNMSPVLTETTATRTGQWPLVLEAAAPKPFVEVEVYSAEVIYKHICVGSHVCVHTKFHRDSGETMIMLICRPT